ncbi:MAG: hypothetical protein QOG72_147 [Sphingomonadales bacterium]|jgi:hypothetical protein|nr:hypothetical protein [Sphingomonadales bacterium]
MTLIPLLGGVAIALLAVTAFVSARRRIRSGAANNWRNQAYLAREADGSWSENECAVSREDQAPPQQIAGW